MFLSAINVTGRQLHALQVLLLDWLQVNATGSYLKQSDISISQTESVQSLLPLSFRPKFESKKSFFARA